MTKDRQSTRADLGARDPNEADKRAGVLGMAEAREAIERAQREGAQVLRAKEPADIERALRAGSVGRQLAPPASAPPVLTIAHRFRAQGYLFDRMMALFVKRAEEDPSRIISFAEVVEDGEAWVLITEQREVPEFYSPAYYTRRERSSTC